MIEEQKAQLELTKQELGKPFSREEEYQEKSKKLALVIAAIECGLSELPPPSAKIEEPYLIEVKSQDQIEKLKESGIEFDTPETNDGKLIVRIEKKMRKKSKRLSATVSQRILADKNVILYPFCIKLTNNALNKHCIL